MAINKKKRFEKIAKAGKKEVALGQESVSSVVHKEYVLSLIGSIIVIATAILFLAFPKNFGLGFVLFPKVTMLLGLLNLASGVAMFITTLSMKSNPREAAVLILVFSLVALIFPPNGMIIGSIFGIIGSVLVLIKLK